MLVASALLLFGCVLPGLSLPLEENAISVPLYNDLQFYFKYATSAYANTCRNPNGNTLIVPINVPLTGTQGFIARDDKLGDIVVAFRGSESLRDFVLDINATPVPFEDDGINIPDLALVHSGFLNAYTSVRNLVLSTVGAQLKLNPRYKVITTGHSLGGALASLAAISIKSHFPSASVRMYTYGQPRTGNPGYAFWINRVFGPNAYRSVHTIDAVPAVPIRAVLYNQEFALGFRHHGIEYWQNGADPASPAKVRQCAGDGEDDTCSYSVAPSVTDLTSVLLNLPKYREAHGLYYGIRTNQTFCRSSTTPDAFVSESA